MSEAEIGTGFVDKGMNYGGAYQISFGLMKDRTRYVDPLAGEKGSDMRTELNKVFKKGYANVTVKALSSTAGGGGTAGYALVPVYVDPRIVDQSRKYTPLTELIPRVANQGMTADYNIITAKGAAVTAGEDAALTDVSDTYDRQSQDIKFLYSVGRLTGPMQAAMPSYMLEGFQPSGAGMVSGNVFNTPAAPNAKQLEVLMRARALKELEENLILNGDASSDSTEFNGIVTQQSTTNQTDLSGAALDWDHVEDAIEAAFVDGGRPKLAVASPRVVTRLRKIMIDVLRIPAADIRGGPLAFGINPEITLQTMVGPVPVIPSQYLSNVSGSASIYFLDTDFIEMRVLQDMTYEDLAKTNDSQKFMLKIYECLVMKSTPFNSFITNVE